MENFTPLYAIAYANLNGMQNLRFDKGYFHVLVLYGIFYKRKKKTFFPMFSYVIETLVKVWENSKLRETLDQPTGSCSNWNFSSAQTSTLVSIQL